MVWLWVIHETGELLPYLSKEFDYNLEVARLSSTSQGMLCLMMCEDIQQDPSSALKCQRCAEKLEHFPTTVQLREPRIFFSSLWESNCLPQATGSPAMVSGHGEQRLSSSSWRSGCWTYPWPHGGSICGLCERNLDLSSVRGMHGMDAML